MGPLTNIKVVELAGLGAAPFCGMLLADLGAEVIRVDRADMVVGKSTSASRSDVLNRGKLSIGVNLKDPEGVDLVLRLVEHADALIEGFRPGVTERLGVGPAECLARNQRLVYGRMTGWGQDGPLATAAGHDIDYIAISGALHAIGPKEAPTPPLNLVGDFGGGGMLLVVGVLAALLQARADGVGQVVDAAMVDGSALLNAATYGFLSAGAWEDRRAANLLDGGAPFYSVYETADGGHLAVGALEPQFYAELLSRLGMDPGDLPDQSDRSGWPRMRQLFAERFKTRTRDEWAAHFEGSDACVAPVLSLEESTRHPHNVARGVFAEVDGVVQPAAAPRFSNRANPPPRPPSYPGRDTDEVLQALGFSPYQIGKLRGSGSIA